MPEVLHEQTLRILLRTDDPVRRQGLSAMLEAAGHVLVTETPTWCLRSHPRRRTTTRNRRARHLPDR